MATEAAVGFVIETIGNLVIEEAKFIAGVSEQVEELQVELGMLRSFLRDAESKKNEHRDIKVWIAESRDLAYEAEDLLEEYALRISSKRENFSKRIMFCFLNECYFGRSIGLKIQKLKTKISNIRSSFHDYGITSLLNEREDSSSSSQQHLRRTYSHVANDDFICLDDDVEKLVSHLVNENCNDDDDLHKVVSISGMGGLGKTTLARKVYNHPSIQGYFENCVWVCISQSWKKRDILEGILIKFFPKERELIMNWRDEELMRKLSQTFINKKCMVVLDDIWSTEAWDCLKEAFPLRRNGSKILLTTRNKNVALHIGPNGFHHTPRLLNPMECWELIKRKVFGAESQIVEEHMHEMEKLGTEMAKYCGGLPLAVVVLGGILATKRGIEEWKIIHKNVKAHIKGGKDNMEEHGEVKNILELSYKELPLKLKPCFLYLGRYPEDSEVYAERLYQLWITEGMISSKDQIGEESMMDVADRYLRELKERSLVQVVINEISIVTKWFKICRLHDLIRDLSLEKAKEENLFSVVDSRNGFDNQAYKSSSPTNRIHRLFIHFEKSEDVLKYVPPQKRITRHLRSLELIVENIYEGPMARIIYSQISQCRMLRSLEIRGPFLPKGNVFDLCCSVGVGYLKLSEGIGNLIHLKFLSLSGHLFLCLPLSFGNLKQLQILDLSFLDVSYIPNIIWKMTQLKHLFLPIRNWEAFGCEELRFDGLNKLEVFEVFNSECCCFEDLVKLTNLQRLRAQLTIKHVNILQILILLLDSKSLIEISLIIKSCDDERVFINVEERSTIFNKLFSCVKIIGLTIAIPMGSLPKYDEFGLTSNLVYLVLENSELQEDPMETLGKLCNLKYLHFRKNTFLGTEMRCYSGDFLQLRTLTLDCLPNLKNLIIEERAMPNLSFLNIWKCLELEMIPDGLKFITTLKELSVRFMPQEFKRRLQVIDGEEGEDIYKIRHVPKITIR